MIEQIIRISNDDNAHLRIQRHWWRWIQWNFSLDWTKIVHGEDIKEKLWNVKVRLFGKNNGEYCTELMEYLRYLRR